MITKPSFLCELALYLPPSKVRLCCLAGIVSIIFIFPIFHNKTLSGPVRSAQLDFNALEAPRENRASLILLES